MAKKTKTNEAGPHGPLGQIVLRFDVPGETMLAIYNALSYILSHREEYISEADDCPTCLKAMDAFRRYLARVIDHAPVYEVKGKNN